jgi:hypothetical protein
MLFYANFCMLMHIPGIKIDPFRIFHRLQSLSRDCMKLSY